jgi:hypothetical protein
MPLLPRRTRVGLWPKELLFMPPPTTGRLRRSPPNMIVPASAVRFVCSGVLINVQWLQSAVGAALGRTGGG